MSNLNTTVSYTESLLGTVDPRVFKWLMMESPVFVLSVVLSYLAFVTALGPAWMRNRKPFELRKTMISYNFFLVVANGWIFNKLGKHAWYGKYNWICEPAHSDVSEDTMAVLEAGWYMLTLKLIELLDTVFFILRKKTSQVTSLHVIHHTILPIAGWYMSSRGPGGYNSLFGFLNALVHTFMYLYYGLAALGPSMQKYLWWKKYLTLLQIGQFVIMFFIMIGLAIAPKCEVNPRMVAVNLFMATLFFVMFLNFYVRSYNTQKKSTSVRMKEATSHKNGCDVSVDQKSYKQS